MGVVSSRGAASWSSSVRCASAADTAGACVAAITAASLQCCHIAQHGAEWNRCCDAMALSLDCSSSALLAAASIPCICLMSFMPWMALCGVTGGMATADALGCVAQVVHRALQQHLLREHLPLRQGEWLGD